MYDNRITAAIQRVESGLTTISDAEIIRAHVNALAIRAVADRDRILALQRAAWDVIESARGGDDLHGAVEHLAAISEYRESLA